MDRTLVFYIDGIIYAVSHGEVFSGKSGDILRHYGDVEIGLPAERPDVVAQAMLETRGDGPTIFQRLASAEARIEALQAQAVQLARQDAAVAEFDWQPAETKPVPYQTVLIELAGSVVYTTGHWAVNATPPAWVGFAGNQSPPYYRIEDGFVRRWRYIQAARLEAATGSKSGSGDLVAELAAALEPFAATADSWEALTGYNRVFLRSSKASDVVPLEMEPYQRARAALRAWRQWQEKDSEAADG